MSRISFHRSDRGFSLIELLIVIVLLGIMAAMAVPSFTGMIDRSRVDRAADRLVADVSHARMSAVRSGQKATVSFENSGYVVTTVAQSGDEVSRTVNLSDGRVPISLNVESGSAELAFNSRGLLSSGTGTSLILTGPAGRTERVRITVVGNAYR